MNMKRQKSCEQWHELLAMSHPEKDLSPVEYADLEAHVAECVECAERRRQYRTMVASLRARVITPPHSLSHPILAYVYAQVAESSEGSTWHRSGSSWEEKEAVFTGQGQARKSPLARRRERGSFVVEDFDIIEVSSMNIVTSNSEQFVRSWEPLSLGRRVRSKYPFAPRQR